MRKQQQTSENKVCPVLKSTWKMILGRKSMSIQERLKGSSWDCMNGDDIDITALFVT